MSELLIYAIIGFVVASIMVYFVGDKIIKDDAFPLPFVFVVSGLVWPLTIILVILYFIIVSSCMYVMWLSNPKKMKETFEFYKEVYILYGESGASNIRGGVPKIWDERIIKKYQNTNVYPISKTIYVNYDDEKFTQHFYRRMKYSWLPW